MKCEGLIRLNLWNGNISMSLLLTDDFSIIESIKEIHAQHVDLTPDNSHVRRYTGGNSHG